MHECLQVGQVGDGAGDDVLLEGAAAELHRPARHSAGNQAAQHCHHQPALPPGQGLHQCPGRGSHHAGWCLPLQRTSHVHAQHVTVLVKLVCELCAGMTRRFGSEYWHSLQTNVRLR